MEREKLEQPSVRKIAPFFPRFPLKKRKILPFCLATPNNSHTEYRSKILFCPLFFLRIIEAENWDESEEKVSVSRKKIYARESKILFEKNRF